MRLRAFTVLALTGAILVTSAAVAQAAPPTPTGLRVTGTTPSTATLTWNASRGAVEYRVFEYAYDWNAGEYRDELRATVREPTARVENLFPDKNYMLLVRAVDASGALSGRSEIVHAQTPMDTTGPTTPGNARATSVSFTTVELEWERSTDDHFVAGYWLRVDGGPPRYTTAGTTATIRQLDPGKPHTVEVLAGDHFVNLSQPATVKFTTLADNEPPTAPANLRGNAGHLTWDASRDNSGEANYVLFVDGQATREESGFDKTFFSFDFCNTFFPAPSGTHKVTVRARDRAGNLSAPSNEITVEVP